MLDHGGRLREAAAHYNIPLADWLDLSTGINPHGWPVPTLPAEVWQRLPEDNDGLESAAASYYNNPGLLRRAAQASAVFKHGPTRCRRGRRAKAPCCDA